MKHTFLIALLTLIVRLVVAGVFAFAALPKIKDPVAFAASIHDYQFIDGALVSWTAVILPWLELTIAVGILIPTIRRASAACIGLLLIAFISLHASAWQRGLDISCGCFGTATQPTTDYPLLILRNLALLVAAAWVLWRDCTVKSRTSTIAH